MNYKMIEYDHAVKTAACVSVCNKIIKIEDITMEGLSQDFNAPTELIRQCALELFVILCSMSNDDKLTAVRRKFSQEQYSHVAALKICIKGGASTQQI